MRIFWILALTLTLTTPAFSADGKPAQTKELMGKFLTEMEALKPYMVSDDKFNDTKNFNEIDSHLKELSRLSKKAAHDPRLQLPGYRVSSKVLQAHVADTERIFRVGNKSYARWMLNSTLSVCMTCHTQLPTVSRQMKEFEKYDTLTSPFDQAEFLFSTRAFDQAKVGFEKIILSYPEGNFKADQIESALERMITYYIRIKRSPEEANTALEKYRGNKKLPAFVIENIKAWAKAIADWKKGPNLDPSKATDAQILDYAKKSLDPKVSSYVMTADNPQAALYLRVSGILYEYLHQHPASTATPDLLYWLAICDKGLNSNFFFSLGDIYLKECITRFPQAPIAMQCYEEYESSTILSYSGSGGTHLPEDVKLELGRLKALILAPPSQGIKH